jgi:Uma2 family endonuclease
MNKLGATSIPIHLRDHGLHSGDRMTREEFHHIYKSTPEDFRAELVGGVVYVASPVKIGHGRNHAFLVSLFCEYEGATPGVEMSDNTTVSLGDDAEPQPDLYMRILPEFGGQSKTSAKDYVEGPPELIAEVALTSHSIDLHDKRRDYARHGVLEYMVLSLREKKFRWFDLRRNRETPIDADGICRARCFPGLWIDVEALLRQNRKRLMRTLKQGLKSAEHASFVAKLAAAERKLRKHK